MNTDLQPARASLAEVPEYHIRPASSSSAVSQQVESPPAYVIEWSAQTCQRTLLSTVDDLRTEIARGKGNGSDHADRLFVIHGLPVDHIKALRSSLEIDPAFIEAHAARRRYRPLRWRKEAKFAHYEYPELVRGFDAAAGEQEQLRHAGDGGASRGMRAIDLMGDPVVRSISQSADVAAVFCRCSLWFAPQADVLFLDRPLWRDPSSPLRKARRPSSVTKPYRVRPGSAHERTNVWDVTLADGDEIGSLEDDLLETLKDATTTGDAVMSILSRLAYDHWVDMFELLDPQSQPSSHDTASFYWRLMQSLEQNVDSIDYLGWQGRQPDAPYPNWRGLLARTQRRIELLPIVRPRSPLTKQLPADSKKPTRNSTFNSSSLQTSTAAAQARDDNQRGLDRVAYLGGILIPFSIVSGILSMSDPYDPNGSQFWVFWAISIPFVALTILIIYVDIIRKAEVWVEVAAENVLAPAMPGGVVVPIRVDTVQEKTQTVTWRRVAEQNGQAGTEQPNQLHRQHPALATPHLRESVTYTFGDEEQVIDLPVSAAAETGVTANGLQEMPLVEPSVILERPSDGSKPKAWKRQQLGWAGAVKAIIGYHKPRRAEDVPLGVATLERRKTRTY